MKAVTMTTPNYLEEFFHFYDSFTKYNQLKIVCYLINFPKEKADFMREYFDIEFRTKEGNFENEKKKRPKVTHLKGQFLNEVARDYKDDVIWVDSSKIYQIDFSWLEDEIKNYDHILVVRPGKKSPREYYSAGFFAFNKHSTELNRYQKECERNRMEWFADQMAFSKLRKDKQKEIYYSDFYTSKYDKSAYIIRNYQTDKLNKKEATKKHFREILQNEEKINDFFNRMPKQILAFLHNPNEDWCYSKTIKEIKENSQHEIKVCERPNDPSYLKDLSPDLVWSRGGAFHMDNFFRHRPDLKEKTLASITTGGDLLDNRIERSIRYAKQTKATIVQNEDSRLRLKNILPNHKVYLLPNGIDLNKYQNFNEPKEFVVGFAGRRKDDKEAHQKGYSLVKQACEILNVKLKVCSNIPSENYPTNEMPNFYNQISCLVLPSSSEGCSNTILEAQACERPVITTKIAYHGEQCTDKENIVFCSRSVWDIVQKIKHLKENPKQRKKIAQNGLKFAKQHDIKEIAKLYDEVFNNELK